MMKLQVLPAALEWRQILADMGIRAGLRSVFSRKRPSASADGRAPKGDGSPTSREYNENTVPQGIRRVSAHATQGTPSPSEKLQTKRLMLLIESKARDAHLNRAVRQLRLESSKYDVLVHELRKDGDAERSVRTALDAATLNPAEKTVDVFVAVGGDHTANAVVNALVACGAPPEACMAVVPRGQGPHDIAASLKVPTNVSEALQIAAAGSCLPLDLGALNKKQVFMNLVNTGLTADLDHSNTGKTAAAMHAPCMVSVLHPASETGSHGLPPEPSEQHGCLAFLSVGTSTIFPGATPNGGLLDVIYAINLSDEKRAALSQALATGKGLESLHDDMQHTKVPWLEVHAPGGTQVRVDGEEVEEFDLRFEILPARIRCAVPDAVL